MVKWIAAKVGPWWAWIAFLVIVGMALFVVVNETLRG
ncbi:hypothetical protein LCGC14_0998680 [marine sediment metagenome]|uniref:Uncharacterized protein n=1 Tax=marine sediment metagenome TaxID=412755 RepID=A0A0F9QM62_9ZZZZ